MIFSVPRPARDSEADYRIALSKRADTDRALLLSVEEKVFEAYQKYDQARGIPYLVTAIAVDGPCARALKGNYPLTYSGKRLQEISEQAFAAAPHELCPMCGRVTPTTIDHFLPKDKYPEFSLFVNNLVPVCPDCNRYKSTLTGSQEEGRFFHAYYDDVPADVPLLISKISVGEGVLVTFSVNDALSGSLYKNAKYQFEKLRLGKLYPRAAVPELVERCDSFAAAFASGGSVAVAREARRIGRGIERKLGRQYWKVALYHGISVSQSFCNGGFGLLGGKSLASSRSVMEEAAAWRSWRAGP